MEIHLPLYIHVHVFTYTHVETYQTCIITGTEIVSSISYRNTTEVAQIKKIVMLL